jgi:small nuclear ribonucleoprotein G
MLRKNFLVKLNGGRHVIGILRGFDPFMNMVIDESIEECKDGTKNNIGMVVSYISYTKVFYKNRYKL